MSPPKNDAPKSPSKLHTAGAAIKKLMQKTNMTARKDVQKEISSLNGGSTNGSRNTPLTLGTPNIGPSAHDFAASASDALCAVAASAQIRKTPITAGLSVLQSKEKPQGFVPSVVATDRGLHAHDKHPSALHGKQPLEKIVVQKTLEVSDTHASQKAKPISKPATEPTAAIAAPVATPKQLSLEGNVDKARLSEKEASNKTSKGYADGSKRTESSSSRSQASGNGASHGVANGKPPHEGNRSSRERRDGADRTRRNTSEHLRHSPYNNRQSPSSERNKSANARKPNQDNKAARSFKGDRYIPAHARQPGSQHGTSGSANSVLGKRKSPSDDELTDEDMDPFVKRVKEDRYTEQLKHARESLAKGIDFTNLGFLQRKALLRESRLALATKGRRPPPPRVFPKEPQTLPKAAAPSPASVGSKAGISITEKPSAESPATKAAAPASFLMKPAPLAPGSVNIRKRPLEAFSNDNDAILKRRLDTSSPTESNIGTNDREVKKVKLTMAEYTARRSINANTHKTKHTQLAQDSATKTISNKVDKQINPTLAPKAADVTPPSIEKVGIQETVSVTNEKGTNANATTKTVATVEIAVDTVTATKTVIEKDTVNKVTAPRHDADGFVIPEIPRARKAPTPAPAPKVKGPAPAAKVKEPATVRKGKGKTTKPAPSKEDKGKHPYLPELPNYSQFREKENPRKPIYPGPFSVQEPFKLALDAKPTYHKHGKTTNKHFKYKGGIPKSAPTIETDLVHFPQWKPELTGRERTEAIRFSGLDKVGLKRPDESALIKMQKVINRKMEIEEPEKAKEKAIRMAKAKAARRERAAAKEAANNKETVEQNAE